MNQHINLDLFCVCFDQRLKDWYNSEDDMFFPWSPDYTLSFVVRGTANAEDTLNMRFRVYEGTNYSNATNNKNLIIDSTDNEVNTNSTGFFYTQINTANHLPKPAKENFVDEYTAELSIDGKILETRLFQIACLPTDVNRVVKPIQLSYNPYFKKQGKESMPISLTFRHLNKDNFYIVMGAYYAYLTEDEELFEKPGNIMPAFDFQVLNLYADDDTATISFHLGADPDRKYYGKEPYLVFTVAGKTFLKCPLSKIHPQTSEEELEPFIVADEQPMEDGDGPILMPDGFANLLDYLDRRRVFDTNRPGSPIEWKRRHLVLTGKKGTGKRTAAQRLGKKLVEDGTAQDIAELNAIDMLDPTNGYSPKVEETLDSNADNLLVINNAEALALKGAVGSLTGIEILANKLLKMKNITVVLLGGKGRMEELIKMCEPARELFYTFYDFDDVEPEVMTRLSVKWLKDMNFRLEEEARKKLFHYFERAYSLRGMNFANMYMARQTIDDEILPRLVRRTISTEQLQPFAPPPLADMNLIVADDIPQAEERDPSVPLKKLESLIGLDNVKQSIINHTSLVRLNKIRADRGFYNRMPPMHMVFTGNPGTGKTTIAEYLGEIYRGIGALSSGHLVQTDRSKLVGQYIGDTEKNTLNAIQRASGGVLFIDEAYNLFVKSDDNRDFGMRVIETLLTYLSLEETVMIVILAG